MKMDKAKNMLLVGMMIGTSCSAVLGEVKPHLLYINADDLGIMDVGYNNPKYNTLTSISLPKRE